jgi:hypothetical protein
VHQRSILKCFFDSNWFRNRQGMQSSWDTHDAATGTACVQVQRAATMAASSIWEHLRHGTYDGLETSSTVLDERVQAEMSEVVTLEEASELVLNLNRASK